MARKVELDSRGGSDLERQGEEDLLAEVEMMASSMYLGEKFRDLYKKWDVASFYLAGMPRGVTNYRGFASAQDIAYIRDEYRMQCEWTERLMNDLIEGVIDELVDGTYSPFMVLQALSDVVRGKSWRGDVAYNDLLERVLRSLKLKLEAHSVEINSGELFDPTTVRGGVMVALEKILPCVHVARQAKINEYAIAVLSKKLAGLAPPPEGPDFNYH